MLGGSSGTLPSFVPAAGGAAQAGATLSIFADQQLPQPQPQQIEDEVDISLLLEAGSSEGRHHNTAIYLEILWASSKARSVGHMVEALIRSDTARRVMVTYSPDCFSEMHRGATPSLMHEGHLCVMVLHIRSIFTVHPPAQAWDFSGWTGLPVYTGCSMP